MPVVAAGGMGKVEHLIDAVNLGGASAVAMADILHMDVLRFTKYELAASSGLKVRSYE